MSKQIQLRRGTTAQHSTFTGAEGECTVDTTKDTVVVHDGATVGGYPLSKEPSSQTLSGYTIASSAALPASSDTINQAIGKLAKQLTANGILKSNGTVVSAATAGSDYLNTSDIIDTLVSTSTTDALSANMGKSLQDTKSALPAAQVLTDYAIAETASLPASTDTINSAIGKLSKTASDTTSQLADINENMDLLDTALNALASRIYPVGSIYMSVSSANPSMLLGGTWEAWGAGRVPVGVDTAQTEFNSVQKTGGTKTNSLTASQNGPHDHGFPARDGAVGTLSGYTPDAGVVNVTDKTGFLTGSSGNGDPINNLQPYITCYMWLRTA